MSVAEPKTIGTSSISCMSYRRVMWNIHEPTPIDSRVRYRRKNLKKHTRTIIIELIGALEDIIFPPPIGH